MQGRHVRSLIGGVFPRSFFGAHASSRVRWAGRSLCMSRCRAVGKTPWELLECHFAINFQKSSIFKLSGLFGTLGIATLGGLAEVGKAASFSRFPQSI